MSNAQETIDEIVHIASSIIGGLAGNIPAIISTINLLLEAYDKIKDSPGEFSLDDFQRRIDALPDYDV